MREYNRAKRNTVSNSRKQNSIPLVLQEIFEQNQKEDKTPLKQRMIQKTTQR